jgi:hypothetical protein
MRQMANQQTANLSHGSSERCATATPDSVIDRPYNRQCRRAAVLPMAIIGDCTSARCDQTESKAARSAMHFANL